jgi:hypothetical protein
MRSGVIALIAVAACGSKSDPKPDPGSAKAPAVPADAAAVVPKPAPVPAPALPRRAAKPPTPAQRAEYKKRMTAGWALQKQEKWAEAVVEFEAATHAIEADQRAVAELGFSAMNAGDFAKARRADDEAVQVAADKKVKAAALYNLGVVLEKSNDKVGALRAYLASLQLRPNKTVEQAVGHLGATPEKPPPFCPAGDKPCDCIIRVAFTAHGSEDDVPTCERKDSPSPGFVLYHVAHEAHRENWDYLLDEHDQLVAVIGGGYEYGFGKFDDGIELDKLDPKTVGGHRVLWIQTTDDYTETISTETDVDMDITKHTRVTICLPGDAKTPTRCPLRDVPIAESHTVKGVDTKTTLDLAIADDGTATLKLVSGASDDQIAALVGPHKLW